MQNTKLAHRRTLQRIQFEKLKLEKSRNVRLLLGSIVFILFIVIAAREPSLPISICFLLTLGLFAYFIKTSRLQKVLIRKLTALSEFYHRQTLRRDGSFNDHSSLKISDLPTSHQVLCQDLHLFGPQSLFSLIDETLTQGGQARLRDWILYPLTSIDKIKDRQTQVETLSKEASQLKKLISLRPQNFRVASKNLEAQLKSELVTSSFNLFFYLHLLAMPVLWGSFFYLLLNPSSLPLWGPFVLYLLFFFYSKKAILHGFKRAEDYGYQLNQLEVMLSFLELNFSSPESSELLKTIKTETPSKNIKKLKSISAALSIQAHPMAYLFMNAILPWDYIWTKALESWRTRFLQTFPSWMEELYNFEALTSLSLFKLYHAQTWPNWSDSAKTLCFTSLKHPLLPQESAVSNSLDLGEAHKLVLITGSNMSGKSTFLRTVGINQSLALLGAPVFATSYKCSYFQLFSCLQVSDSLEGGISTFYYEVKAIKELIERARNGEPVLYLIDEIFRGTNNKERYQGSRAVINELVQHSSVMGFISTHDLELAKLQETHPGLSNWHFKDEVSANRLKFSYKIQEGPCPSTNALKIMQFEGLPID